MHALSVEARRREINVPFAAGRGDVLSTLPLRDSSGVSFWLVLPAFADPSLEVAIVG